MTRDLKRFFDTVRSSPFGRGRLKQSQVSGMQTIMAVWDARRSVRPTGADSDKLLAYILATAAHETALSFMPLPEVGLGHGHIYGMPDPDTGHAYYGRGYVQLTWKYNYARMGTKLRIPLVQDPNLALDPTHAAEILISGMMGGDFTGLPLSRFFDSYADLPVEDPIGARTVVNGDDCAEHIADLYAIFLRALTPATPETVPASVLASVPAPAPVIVVARAEPGPNAVPGPQVAVSGARQAPPRQARG